MRQQQQAQVQVQARPRQLALGLAQGRWRWGVWALVQGDHPPRLAGAAGTQPTRLTSHILATCRCDVLCNVLAPLLARSGVAASAALMGVLVRALLSGGAAMAPSLFIV